MKMHALIGQSAMVYCASKLMEISCWMLGEHEKNL